MDVKTILILGMVVGVGFLAYFLFASPGSASGSTASGLPDLGGAGFLSGINNFPGQDWLTNFETAGSDLVNTGKKLLDHVSNLVDSTQKVADSIANTAHDLADSTRTVVDTTKHVVNAGNAAVQGTNDFITYVGNGYNATVKFLTTPPWKFW